MDRININLLPKEIREEAKKTKRKATVVKLSLGILILLILLTSVLLSLVIFQHSYINELNSSIDKSKTRATSLKDKEIVTSLLKNRLDSINTLSNSKYPQSEIFELITSLLPENVKLVSLSVDKGDKITIQGETSDTKSLKTLFDNLTSPTEHQGKISSAKLESLSKGPNNRIQFDLIIVLSKDLM